MSNKLSLKKLKKAVNLGGFVEKTISFIGLDGEEFSGEILVRQVSYGETLDIYKLFGYKKGHVMTHDEFVRGYVFQSVYEPDTEKPFFANVAEVSEIPADLLKELYIKSDEVNNFSGNHPKTILKEKNSGASSSVAESVEEPLQKPSEE